MKQADILGAWRLKEFSIEGPGGVVKPWGNDLRGLLIYEPAGLMSVSIQRAVPDPKPADWEALDDYLFYARTYVLADENTVEHHVEIATDRDRVGQVLVRQAIYEGTILRLSNRTPSGGTARIVWSRGK